MSKALNKILVEWVNHASVQLENENGDVLKFKTRDDRPRFTVDYKLTDEQKLSDLNLEDKGVTAPFNIKDFEVMLDLIQLTYDMADNKEFPKSTSVVCLYHYDKDGNKSDEKLDRTEVKFFIEDNIFKLSFRDIMYTDRVTTFEFGYLPWQKFFMGDKEVPKHFLSKKHANNFITNIREILKVIKDKGGKMYIQEREVVPVSMQTESSPIAKSNDSLMEESIDSMLESFNTKS